MIPEQIQAARVLEMNVLELRQFVRAQATENPALVLDEGPECPWCGGPLGENGCLVCGKLPAGATDEFELAAREPRDHWPEEDERDPFAAVAAPVPLREYLKQQARFSLDGRERMVAEQLVDALDDDGYLRENTDELASLYGLRVDEVEGALARMQSFDPPGVGARSIQECLLIQLTRLPDRGTVGEVTQRMLEEHWEDLLAGNVSRLANDMGESADRIQDCLRYIRSRLAPHPGALYSAPWMELCPRGAPAAAPDVVVKRSRYRNELMAEVVDVFPSAIGVSKVYRQACERTSKPKCSLSLEERRHVKESVECARRLLDAIDARRAGIARIAGHLVREQAAFLSDGPQRLRPMMQKDVARKLGLHESTVCRALINKHFQSPTGEVMSFEVFFDPSLPVKEQMVRLMQSADGSTPLSDGEIAERLQGLGWKIARRTVAKYRSQLRVMPQGLRKLMGDGSGVPNTHHPEPMTQYPSKGG